MIQNRTVTTVYLFNVSQSANIITGIKNQISPSRRNTGIVVCYVGELLLKIVLGVFTVNHQIGAYSTAALISYIYKKLRRLFDYSA